MMQRSIGCCFRVKSNATFAFQQIRCTWIVRRLKPAPATPDGEDQRRPDEKPMLMLSEIVFNVNRDEQTQPIEVILTKYVDGLGERGDVVKVPRRMGRHELLLGGSAVYASPFNLKMFEEERKRRAEELAFMPKMTPEKWQMLKTLSDTVVVVGLNLEQSWILNRTHVRLALRQAGVAAENDCIVLPHDIPSGPNLSLQSKLFRFYLVINKQILVPMIGRLHHVTSDENEEVISDVTLESTNAQELVQYDLPIKEDVYVHPRPTLNAVDVNAIWKVIKNRPKRT